MNDVVIDAARSHWALGDAPVTLVAARENHVYRVETKAGPAALRLHRPGYRTNEQINSELQWMAMLAENGIAVPKPIQSPDGTNIQTFDGVTVSLLSWIDGTPQSKLQVSTDTYFKLGCVLARMHELADAWTPPSSFTCPTWDLLGDRPTWGRFWENPSLSQEQKQFFLQFRDIARQEIQATSSLDFGLIHADLVPDNVLIDDNRLWLIDFDDGGFGYRLFDLATITRRCRRHAQGEQLIAAVIAGYSAKRPLGQEALPLFEALRACTYVGWNISRINEVNGATRNTRFITEAHAAIEECLSD